MASIKIPKTVLDFVRNVLYLCRRDIFSSSGSKGCFPLAVPSIDNVWWGRIRLRAQFDGVDDYRVDSSKEIYFSRRDFMHLIQTDKAWYTPGQLVRFRVLSLDHKLLPLLGPVSL